MAIASIIFMVHIFCYIVSLKETNVPIDPFFNNMLFLMENSVAKFAAIPLFICLGYYFLFCAHKGNVTLGMRFMFV